MFDGLRERLFGEPEEPDPYDTKTVRFHLPERGQYLYVTITRITGTETILEEIGYGGEYYQFQTMSMNGKARLADTDLYALGRRHPWSDFMDLYPADLLYALDSGKLPWEDIPDGAHLDELDVRTLIELAEGDDE